VKIEIKCRWTGNVLFETEAASLKAAVEKAVEAKVSLARAYLAGANLADANLARAYLAGANLADANLADANLADANLAGAYLADANLADANLAGADLARANLAGANLAGAKNLTEAQLIAFRDDLWAVLSAAPREAAAVRDALLAGKVNGSVYEGDCACLVGTIANARHCAVGDLGMLKPNSSRLAEVWFMPIRPGDTSSIFATLATKWVNEWLENVGGAFNPERQAAGA
jgi:hypothetical protein